MNTKGANFKKLLLAGVAAAGMAFAAADAQAAFIGTTPGGSNAVFLTPREGWFAADLFLASGAPVNATVELIGFEAGASNSFNINGGGVEFGPVTGTLGTILAPIGTTANVLLNPGLLDFVFTTTVAGPGSVVNGANRDPATNLANFFVTFGATGDAAIDGSTPGGGTVLLIALDDGGAGPDDNHDDLVIRLTITGGEIRLVPEPATLALFGMGLLGLGLAARRRKV